MFPTNKCLSRCRVVDSDLCSKCDLVSDTIQHCLWQCQLVVPLVDKILNFLNQQCQIQETISIEKYLFGFSKHAALNQILLELKKMIFYSWDPAIQIDLFLDIFVSKIRKLMIMEKHISITFKSLDRYSAKWEKYKNIYDFNGPNVQVI